MAPWYHIARRVICRHCGYDLDYIGAQFHSARCPECGRDNIRGDRRRECLLPPPWPTFPVLAALAGAPAAFPVLGFFTMPTIAALIGQSVAIWITGIIGGLLLLLWPATVAWTLARSRIPAMRFPRAFAALFGAFFLVGLFAGASTSAILWLLIHN